jgi:hypothetical protein
VDEHIQILKREHEKGFYIANIRKLREEKRWQTQKQRCWYKKKYLKNENHW